MSIFSRIKDAIFGHKTATAPIPQQDQTGGQIAQGQPAPTIEKPQQVDVEQVLTSIAASKGNPDLNYKRSIVDLMKLLDSIRASTTARSWRPSLAIPATRMAAPK